MQERAKGPRLYLRPASGTRKASWVIRDGKAFVGTGCSTGDRTGAEQRLYAYIADKHRPSRSHDRRPSEINVADVLTIYMTDRGAAVARPNELGQRVTALLAFFGDMRLGQVNGKSCRAYVAHRGAGTAARRELEDLRAAINHHRREGLCSEIVEVTLPEKPPARERWLTESEAARLLWAAWKGGQGKRKHVARFILVALYTGTRATAICQAAMRPTVGRGYVDLDRGVFYRRAPGARETKKRQPPVSLNVRLVHHLRRWHAKGKSVGAIVEWKGEAITRMNKAFRNAAVEAGLPGVTPHVLRHTAITWAMQNGADRWEAAGMFGVTMEMIERVYGHHRPDHGASVHRAITARNRPT